MRQPIRSCLIVATLLAMAPGVRCEEAAKTSELAFVSGGLGAGDPGLAGLLSLNFSVGKRIVELRYATVEEFNLFGPTPAESNEDLGVMVGKLYRGRRGLSYAAVGPGVARSVRRGKQTAAGVWFFGPEYERIEHVTVGLPFELRTTVNAPLAGVGLNLFGNLNTRGSFVGAAVVFQVGKLR